MKKKTKKILLALSSLGILSGIVVALQSKPVSVSAEENAPSQVVANDLKQAEDARDNLYINVDLNNVVNNLYLPEKGLWGAKITWESSDQNVIRTSGTVIRPNDSDADVTLKATISVRTATLTKEFKAHVLKKTTITSQRAQRFEENFSAYKTGQDLSNYYIWELKNGDEIATVEESVENNNMIGLNEKDKVLKIEPLPTLYKDSIYQTKVNLADEMVFEAYVMTSGESAGFQIEFGESSSTKLKIGMINGNFVTGKNELNADGSVASQEKLTPYDEGVWYKLRIEMTTGSNGTFKAYYYDWDHDNKLVELTKEGGESCKDLPKSQDAYFRMRVLTGRHNCKTYISNVVLDVKNNMPEAPDKNPNRELGIGKIDNFVSSYLLIEGEDFTLPELVIHNRFKDKAVLNKGTDYTLSETYGETGKFDVSKQGYYTTHYKIDLLSEGEVIETKELDQTIYVDAKEATAKLDTLRIAPVVRDTDETYVDKEIKISANINRKDATVYYAAVETGSSALTAEQVKSAQGTINGNLKVEDSTFSINIKGLEKNKEYDFYVITSNANGESEVYVKTKISISVYNIEDCDDFFFMCTDPEVQTTDFRLMTDLDFKGYTWLANEITRPNYVGTFDGLNHKITNLHITAVWKKASLFYNFAGTFQNLTFEDCLLEGAESVGFIGGYGAGGAHVNNVKMVNCTVKCVDSKIAGDGYYGLIFGRCEGGSKQGNAVIENVEIINGHVEGPKYVGALVGNLQKMTSLEIRNVYCETSMRSDGAALGLVSRARAPLTFKNIVADIDIQYAKKQAAVLCGEMITEVYAENILGKLRVQGLTQPTYYNNVTGNYSTAAGVKFTYKDVYFFTPDTSIMSEDTVIPVTSSLTVGTVIYDVDFGTTQEWWEKNTWLIDLDTNPNWDFDEELKRPVVKQRDMSKLEFTAAEINAYIDQIGNVISSKSLYYIRKANELYKYCKESEKSQVHKDVLDRAIAQYEEYYESFQEAVDSSNSVNNALTGGIDWSFTEKGAN